MVKKLSSMLACGSFCLGFMMFSPQFASEQFLQGASIAPRTPSLADSGPGDSSDSARDLSLTVHQADSEAPYKSAFLDGLRGDVLSNENLFQGAAIKEMMSPRAFEFEKDLASYKSQYSVPVSVKGSAMVEYKPFPFLSKRSSLGLVEQMKLLELLDLNMSFTSAVSMTSRRPTSLAKAVGSVVWRGVMPGVKSFKVGAAKKRVTDGASSIGKNLIKPDISILADDYIYAPTGDHLMKLFADAQKALLYHTQSSAMDEIAKWYKSTSYVRLHLNFWMHLFEQVGNQLGGTIPTSGVIYQLLQAGGGKKFGDIAYWFRDPRRLLANFDGKARGNLLNYALVNILFSLTGISNELERTSPPSGGAAKKYKELDDLLKSMCNQCLVGKHPEDVINDELKPALKADFRDLWMAFLITQPLENLYQYLDIFKDQDKLKRGLSQMLKDGNREIITDDKLNDFLNNGASNDERNQQLYECLIRVFNRRIECLAAIAYLKDDGYRGRKEAYNKIIEFFGVGQDDNRDKFIRSAIQKLNDLRHGSLKEFFSTTIIIEALRESIRRPGGFSSEGNRQYKDLALKAKQQFIDLERALLDLPYLKYQSSFIHKGFRQSVSFKGFFGDFESLAKAQEEPWKSLMVKPVGGSSLLDQIDEIVKKYRSGSKDQSSSSGD